MLPLKLPHRKRGSTTILLTATGVQDHDDVVYNYALYSCTKAFMPLLSTVETDSPTGLNSDFRNMYTTAVDNQEWPFFEQNESTHHHLLGFNTLHTPQLSTPF